MERVMVVFSSTDIPEELVDFAVNFAREKNANLIILDVRDKEMSERVGDLAEDLGFMGEKVVGLLKKDISQGRCDVIYQRLSVIEQKAMKSKVPYEIIVERGPFVDSIVRVTKKMNVKTVLVQKRDRTLGGEDFKVIRF
jgi:hypothetical protein